MNTLTCRVAVVAMVASVTACAGGNTVVKPAEHVEVCLGGKCSPAAGRFSREELVGGILMMLKANENAEATFCETDARTRQCARDSLSFFVQGGPIPGVASVSAPYITQVGIDKSTFQVKYLSASTVTWLGTPVFCQDQYTEVTVTSPNEILIEAPGFACTWTAFPMLWTLKFAVNFIDFDNSVVAGNYAAGGGGLLVAGGGEGTFAFRLPKAGTLAASGTAGQGLTAIGQVSPTVLAAPVPKAEEVAQSGKSLGGVDAVERGAWETATAENTPAAYRGYLSRFPQGRFASVAKAQIEAVTALDTQNRELAHWERIKASTVPADFDTYLASYPTGLFTDLAALRARRLRAATAEAKVQEAELALWEQVQGSAAVEDVQAYLRHYPDGQFAPTARERVARLRAAGEANDLETAMWGKITDSRDPDDYRRFLQAFPKGVFAGLASARLDGLATASRQNEELAAWERIRLVNDPAKLEAFAGRYPDGQFAPLARQFAAQLRSAESEKAELALWATARTSRDPKDVERYLAAYPKGHFTEAARQHRQGLGQKAAWQGLDFGRYHGLVIGIDHYPSLTNLDTAVNDARAVAATLRDLYGFQVAVLENPDRKRIIDELTSLRRTLGEGENLLIYYAGHGWLDRDNDRGYWLPSDAERDSPANWISTTDITDTLKAMKAKHVMVVADSCYSGVLARSAKLDLRSPDYLARPDYLTRMAGKRARVALTSGGLEPVADGGGGGHSVFAKVFLDVLRQNTEVLEGTRLFSELRRPVVTNAPQTPEYADIRFAGHDGGDFLFVRR